MVSLSPEAMKLRAVPQSKQDAIHQVGQLLVESGHIQPGYVQSMVAREAQANTFLGNGIAIPHGQPQDRGLILETGIAVLQVPDGVEWNPGEVAHLIVGIAAKSDEHLQILANLTQVLGDEATVQRLIHTQNPQDIIDRLTQGEARATAASNGATLADFEQAVDVVVTGGTGLHARPAAAFVDIAKGFAAEIRVRHGQQVANGKSLMALLQLGVQQDGTLRVSAQGHDAAQALAALAAAVAAGLEEEEEALPIAADLPALNLDTPAIAGVSASPGLAIAPLHRFQRGRLVFAEPAADPHVEAERLRRAIAIAQTELQTLYETVKERSGKGKAAIFQAHQEFLSDPDLLPEAIAQISGQCSAAAAWQTAIAHRAQTLEELNDPILSARAVDVRDVGQRVLTHLADRIEGGGDLPTHPVILLADDLTPSDTAGLDPQRIVGFCTAKGGATSHTAIIARSLNIPAVAGVGEAVLTLDLGAIAILDGDGGHLYPHPSAADVAEAQRVQTERQALQDVAQRDRFLPALTADGHRIEVVANIGAPEEALQAVNAGGEGIGLLRTEFLFLNRAEPPSEAEQYQALTTMTRALHGLPLIVRTLDIGGDKAVPYLHQPAEENPFLGVRGVRLCLQRMDLFETQLRAILRAATTGYIRVMFPMVATLEDLRAAKTVLESVRASLDAPPVEVGMMVEVPSAVLMAAEFAQEVDFFSVGTNDLTQYLLAMDRGHPTLAKQADALHPAVLRAIAQTVSAAEAADKWVGVCGGMAGDPLGAMILAGLGVRELSVSVPSIPTVKATLRSRTQPQLQRLAQKALRCRTATEVRAL